MVASREEEGGQQKPHAKHTYIPNSAGSPRNPIPDALCQVLGVLIDQLPEAPSHVRVELRSLRARLARLYKIPLTANASELAWENADGDEEIPE